MTILLTIWSFLKKAPLWLWGALGALLGAFWLRRSGESAGRAQREAEEQERAIEQADTRKDVEDDIAKSDPGSNRDRLGKWVR